MTPTCSTTPSTSSEDFLKLTGTPGHGVPYDGEVTYGPRAEHCWNGDPTLPNAYRASTTTPCTCPRSSTASPKPLPSEQT